MAVYETATVMATHAGGDRYNLVATCDDASSINNASFQLVENRIQFNATGDGEAYRYTSGRAVPAGSSNPSGGGKISGNSYKQVWTSSVDLTNYV